MRRELRDRAPLARAGGPALVIAAGEAEVGHGPGGVERVELLGRPERAQVVARVVGHEQAAAVEGQPVRVAQAGGLEAGHRAGGVERDDPAGRAAVVRDAPDADVEPSAGAGDDRVDRVPPDPQVVEHDTAAGEAPPVEALQAGDAPVGGRRDVPDVERVARPAQAQRGRQARGHVARLSAGRHVPDTVAAPGGAAAGRKPHPTALVEDDVGRERDPAGDYVRAAPHRHGRRGRHQRGGCAARREEPDAHRHRRLREQLR